MRTTTKPEASPQVHYGNILKYYYNLKEVRNVMIKSALYVWKMKNKLQNINPNIYCGLEY